MLTNFPSPVFSAPKYCDTTENKGAYINIGPDLKLQYHKFDAVPHPDIKPMVCNLLLESSIEEIVSLMHIFNNRLMLRIR